jgi:hypothetical protein
MKGFMPSHFPPGPLPSPGQQVRWRHPRLACALGRFNAFGPGPFEVIGARERGAQGGTVLVVQTESGAREIDAAWLGVAEAPRQEDPPPKEESEGGDEAEPAEGRSTQPAPVRG